MKETLNRREFLGLSLARLKNKVTPYILSLSILAGIYVGYSNVSFGGELENRTKPKDKTNLSKYLSGTAGYGGKIGTFSIGIEVGGIFFNNVFKDNVFKHRKLLGFGGIIGSEEGEKWEENSKYRWNSEKRWESESEAYGIFGVELIPNLLLTGSAGVSFTEVEGKTLAIWWPSHERASYERLDEKYFGTWSVQLRNINEKDKCFFGGGYHNRRGFLICGGIFF